MSEKVVSSKNLRNPKDLRIEEISLFNSDASEQVNLYNLFVELNLYEDASSGFLSGDISLTDSTNLIANFPVIGNEKIFFSFFTPGEEGEQDPVRLFFNVYKVSGRQLHNDKTQSYTLHFVSSEMIRNNFRKVRKSFTGNAESLILNIIQNERYGLDSDKELFFDNTINTQKFVSPAWSPLAVINYLKKFSISDNQKSDFVFYEDRDGFHFKSIETIIAEGLKTPESERITYAYRPYNFNVQEPGKHHYRDIEKDMRSIESYTVEDSSNVLENINSGLYASTIQTYNFNKKKFKQKTFDYHEEFENRQTLEKFPVIVEEENLDKFLPSKEPDSRVTFLTQTQDLWNDFEDTKKHERTRQNKESSQSALHNQKLVINVAGDSNLRVGDIIRVIIPSMEKFDKEFVEDRVLTGNYMIMSMRHKVKEDDYMMVLELLKDSYTEDMGTSNV